MIVAVTGVWEKARRQSLLASGKVDKMVSSLKYSQPAKKSMTGRRGFAKRSEMCATPFEVKARKIREKVRPPAVC